MPRNDIGNIGRVGPQSAAALALSLAAKAGAGKPANKVDEKTRGAQDKALAQALRLPPKGTRAKEVAAKAKAAKGSTISRRGMEKHKLGTASLGKAKKLAKTVDRINARGRRKT